MRGFLHRTPEGITAILTDQLGYRFLLTGTPGEQDGAKGYAIEVRMTHVPEALSLPGDEELGVRVAR